MAGCILDKRDGCKGLGGTSVGYWGRDIYKRLASEQIYSKERALLEDQIASGLRVELWIGVTEGNQCSCYKKSQRVADRKCSSCHGVVDGLVPGYLKFGYETLWMSSSDDDVTLTDVQVTTFFQSSKVELSESALTGTIESGDKQFNRSAIGSQWEADSVDFIRDVGNSSVVVEYSTDSGSSWRSLSELESENPSSGVIRFRATLTRSSVDILSPLFEIVRARYSRVDLREQRGDGSYSFGPWIQILNSKPYKGYRKSEYGDVPALDGGMSFWTVGLGTFDPSIELGSREELLSGPNVVVKFLDGVLADDKKYVLLNWQHSDPGAYILVKQAFNVRVADEVGPYSLIW